MYRVGAEFHIPSTDCKIKLDWIQERENAIDRIKQTGKKLTKPIYNFIYTNKQKPCFTVHLEHIERNVSFEVWKLI